MNELDGLDLPQLLDRMHGLAEPAPVAWLPQTAGWWIAFGWLLGVLLLAGWRWALHRRRNRYRRAAITELRTIETAAELPPAESAQRIAALLKRTALAAYPRRDVASLYGCAWAQFLTETTNGDRQIAAAAQMLAAAAYSPDADGTRISKPARRWIRLHHA